MSADPTVVHLFCGAGGGGLGFKRAGFRSLAAIDNGPAACRDYERLVGSPATCADLATMSPADLAALTGGESPDVVFTSPPCKGFSSCLPGERSKTPRYQAMNELALRGVWLALEAWKRPPRLILLENVPRIQTRGAQLLAELEGLLHAYGYAVARSTHDCGELGGLAQHRRRFLLAARHLETVPAFLRVPASKRVRAIGEVLGELPVPLPGSTEGGPMHRLPKLAPINWVRLALIPAGGDWRDLPERVELVHRDARQNGGFGVESWDDPAHVVVAEGTVRNTRASVADPRVTCTRREGGHGVKAWEQPSAPVIAHASIDNFPAQVADPRMRCAGPGMHSGTMGVVGWASPSHTVRAYHNTNNSPAAVADPRVPAIVGPAIDLEDKTPTHLVIRAADGTWHRPMTTLELAALQGFPTRIDGEWLVLDGDSHRGWRERIGNAVPPPAAEAIARNCLATLAAAGDGFVLSSEAIWVHEGAEEWVDA